MQLQLMPPAKERVHSENTLPGGKRSTITSDVSSLMPSCTFMMDVMTFWGADCIQRRWALVRCPAVTCQD